MQITQKLGKQILYSPKFQDIYWSRENGLFEKEYVFLQGNSLYERWKQDRDFTIFELGFGAGLNFLTTWKAWREGKYNSTLNYISTEAFPIPKSEIRDILLDFPELENLSSIWLNYYDDWSFGVHKFFFPKDHLHLTLWIGDALECLIQLPFLADAFFLDGFSPSKNPELWSKQIFTNLVKHVNGYASFSTYSVSNSVKTNAQEAGFTIFQTKGFGKKKSMLKGEMYSKNNFYESKKFLPIPSLVNKKNLEVTIIGTGLAGLNLGYFLLKRGIKAYFLDACSGVGENASCNPLGYFSAKLTKNPTIASRLSLLGVDFTSRMLSIWNEELGIEVGKDVGLFHVLNLEEIKDLQANVQAHNLPAEYLQITEKEVIFFGKKYFLKGVFIKKGGYFYPFKFCQYMYNFLKEKGVIFEWNSKVCKIENSDGWKLFDKSGNLLKQTQYLILCNSYHLNEFEITKEISIQKIRGQIAILDSQKHFFSNYIPILFEDTYLVGDEFQTILGATFNPKDQNLQVNLEHNILLLSRLKNYLQEINPLEGKNFPARVGFRANTKDRLPLLGCVPKVEDYKKFYQNNSFEPQVYENLYILSALGSKGIAYAPILAETLVSLLFEEPPALPLDIIEALHPARFILRDLKKGKF